MKMIYSHMGSKKKYVMYLVNKWTQNAIFWKLKLN